MSKNRSIVNIVKEDCEPKIEELGYDLVDVEYVKEKNKYFLRVYIGKAEGITIDDCQKVSKIVGDKLDELDPVQESYYLEVSSPGLDRPLKTDKDLKRNIGKSIDLSLYKELDGKKKYSGKLLDFTETHIEIGKEKIENKKIERNIIADIKLSIEF